MEDDKKASSGLITKFTIKKIEFNSSAVFLRKLFQSFFVFLVTLRLVTIHIEVQLMKKVIYCQLMLNDYKIRFQGIAHVFFASILSFRNFNWKFDFHF